MTEAAEKGFTLVKHEGVDYFMLQVTPEGSPREPLIEFCYEPGHGPNKVANDRENMNSMTKKAGASQPSSQANHLQFIIHKKFVDQENFKDQATEMLSQVIFPALVERIKTVPFNNNEQPDELKFYARSKQSGNHMELIRDAAVEAGFVSRPVDVFTNRSKTPFEGIALELK